MAADAGRWPDLDRAGVQEDHEPPTVVDLWVVAAVAELWIAVDAYRRADLPFEDLAMAVRVAAIRLDGADPAILDPVRSLADRLAGVGPRAAGEGARPSVAEQLAVEHDLLALLDALVGG